VIKFLIIRLSSIGDIVLTTPVIRNIKQQVEGAEIHFLVKKQFADVVKANPYISKIHYFDGDINATIEELQMECFDYIIDLHKNLRSLKIKNKLKVAAFSFNKLNVEKWLMVNFKINRLPKVHIVDRYLETTNVFDVVNDNKGLDYFIEPNIVNPVDSFPENFKKEFVSIVIGANHYTKQIPTEKIIEICKNIGKPVVLLGGKDDVEKADLVCKFVKENIINTCGKLSINQSALIVKNSALIITPDTGLMHIAAAFKKKIISVWGNTIPEFGMYPYMPDESSKIVQIENLKCRPCTKIGFRKCPKGHFKCMNEIEVETILNAAK
jgi:ADP-heptose:LPS heptosyltransferase